MSTAERPYERGDWLQGQEGWAVFQPSFMRGEPHPSIRLGDEEI